MAPVGVVAAFAVPWIARRSNAGPTTAAICAVIAVAVAGATTWFAACWYGSRGNKRRRRQEFFGLTSGLWCALGAYHLSEASQDNQRAAALIYWAGVAVALWWAARLIGDDYRINPDSDESQPHAQASPNTPDAQASPTTAHAQASSATRPTQAWIANLGVAAAALVPMMLIAGVPGRVTAVAPILWMIAALLNRTGTSESVCLVGTLTALGLVVSLVGLLIVDCRSGVIGLALLGTISIDAFASRRRGVRHLARRTVADADADADRDRRRWKVVPLAGAVAICSIAGSVWLSTITDVRLTRLFLIVGFGLLIGGTFYWRKQGLLLLAVVAVALFWVVRDRSEPAPSSDLAVGELHDSSQIQILALGDSYSSGEGADTFLPDTNTNGANQCRRSPKAYAYGVAAALRPTAQVTFLACSGAVASEFYAVGQSRWWKKCDNGQCRDEVAGWRSQLEAASQYSAWKDSVSTDLKRVILFTIGGNDMLFGAVGKGCALPGDCSALVNGVVGRLQSQLKADPETGRRNSLTATVVEALLQVGDQYPETPIRVLGYPRLLGDASTGTTACTKDSLLPLSPDEMTSVRMYIDAVNATVEAAVVSAQRRGATDGKPSNIAFLNSSVTAYGPEGICDADPEANLVKFSPTDATRLFERLNPLNWTHNSLHPKSLGHAKMAAAITCEVATAVGVGDQCTPQALVTVPFGSTGSPSVAAPLSDCGRVECIAHIDSATTDAAVREIGRRLPPFALIVIGGVLASALADDRLRRRRTHPATA